MRTTLLDVPALFTQHDRPRIVCLCGSTRFMQEFHDVGWELTLEGYIVLTVGVCMHAADHGGEALGDDVCGKLDELHKRKIDLCDWVFVINKGGYIGSSTRSEIEYAIANGCTVVYMEPPPAKPASVTSDAWVPSERISSDILQNTRPVNPVVAELFDQAAALKRRRRSKRDDLERPAHA